MTVPRELLASFGLKMTSRSEGALSARRRRFAVRGLWRFVLVGRAASPFDPAGVVEEGFDVVGEPCPAEELEEVVVVVGEADDLVADRDVSAAGG